MDNEGRLKENARRLYDQLGPEKYLDLLTKCAYANLISARQQQVCVGVHYEHLFGIDSSVGEVADTPVYVQEDNQCPAGK